MTWIDFDQQRTAGPRRDGRDAYDFNRIPVACGRRSRVEGATRKPNPDREHAQHDEHDARSVPTPLSVTWHAHDTTPPDRLGTYCRGWRGENPKDLYEGLPHW